MSQGLERDPQLRQIKRREASHNTLLASGQLILTASIRELVATESGEQTNPADTPETAIFAQERNKLLADLLSNLSYRERQILEMYYEDEFSLEEIASHIDPQIKRERVRRIRNYALLKLRALAVARGLYDDLTCHESVNEGLGSPTQASPPEGGEEPVQFSYHYPQWLKLRRQERDDTA